MFRPYLIVFFVKNNIQEIDSVEKSLRCVTIYYNSKN